MWGDQAMAQEVQSQVGIGGGLWRRIKLDDRGDTSVQNPSGVIGSLECGEIGGNKVRIETRRGLTEPGVWKPGVEHGVGIGGNSGNAISPRP